MNTINHEIHEKEVPSLIEKLLDYLGQDEVDKKLSGYERELKLSGNIYREYYLKNRHPWWQQILLYKARKKKDNLYLLNLGDLMSLAMDAKKIDILKKNMPEKVKRKFRSDLLDNSNAKNYLFELDTAWHFHRKGFDLEWFEKENSKQPEFLATNKDFEIEVECKRISVDAGRKIHRDTFYKFMDYLINPIIEEKIGGEIDIVLERNLPFKENILKQYSEIILNKILYGELEDSCELENFSLRYNLFKSSNISVNPQNYVAEFLKNKDMNSHIVFAFNQSNNLTVDPLCIKVISKLDDSYLINIRRKIKDACLHQLSLKKPGFISCFIPEIEDFTGLEKKGGLLNISFSLFKDEDLKHVAAISFVSDMRYNQKIYGKTTFNPFVIFNNNNCIFIKAKEYKYGIEELN